MAFGSASQWGSSGGIPIGPTPWRQDGFRVVDSSCPIDYIYRRHNARVTRHQQQHHRVQDQSVGRPIGRTENERYIARMGASGDQTNGRQSLDNKD